MGLRQEHDSDARGLQDSTRLSQDEYETGEGEVGMGDGGSKMVRYSRVKGAQSRTSADKQTKTSAMSLPKKRRIFTQTSAENLLLPNKISALYV